MLGVTTGQAVEASLGYFINPLVSVLLGVVVLKEKLRPLQWTAVGIGFVAVGVLTVSYGKLPLIALTLALSLASMASSRSASARALMRPPALPSRRWCWRRLPAPR